MIPKLIFFDMEGTIFAKAYKDSQGNTAPSAWTLLAASLGQDALKEENETKRKWNDNEYAGYVEWMEDTIRIHKKYDLKKDFYEHIMNSVPYHQGVEQTFAQIREAGIRTAILSGGFKSQADRALKDLKIDHAFVACEYLWGEDGDLLHWNLLPVDYEGKVDFMHLIMKEHGLIPKCAFVGDGRNDIPLAQAVDLSISFNGAPELEGVVTHKVREPDFRSILPILGL